MTSRRRIIRNMSAMAVGVWIVLGLVHTTVVLARPVTGWRLMREPGADRAIGVPRLQEDGSRLVTQALGLLERCTPSATTVWIVQSERYHQDTWWYLQMQLAHLRYPQHFYLMTPDSARSTPVDADFVLTLGDAPPTADWSTVAQEDPVQIWQPTR